MPVPASHEKFWSVIAATLGRHRKGAAAHDSKEPGLSEAKSGNLLLPLDSVTGFRCAQPRLQWLNEKLG